MRRAISSVALAALAVALSPGAAAAAAPGLPELFYGSAPGKVGTEIDAVIGGSVVASTTLVGGSYGAAPHLLILPDPEGTRAGSAVTFTIGGVAARESAPFINGAITRLDLTLPPGKEAVAFAAPNSAISSVSPLSAATSSRRAAPATARSLDLTGDGRITLADLAYLISRWGLATLAEPADLNGDGVVDLLDFNMLIFRL